MHILGLVVGRAATACSARWPALSRSCAAARDRRVRPDRPGRLIAIVGGPLFVVVTMPRCASRLGEAQVRNVSQAALQWLFLRVEDVSQPRLGDRLNPLYHLGAITFFLFWWWPAAACTSTLLRDRRGSTRTPR